MQKAYYSFTNYIVTANYPDGMTVAELKALLRDWPETDEHGNPCSVLVCDSDGISHPVSMAKPLTMRKSEDGSKVWADFMFGHNASGNRT
ncbi:MAG: hypothetical protein PHQ40_17250 [Anaerolineaceae bacterium]|nr:hypothetical protein [Anaerolineaceae bacterium]